MNLSKKNISPRLLSTWIGVFILLIDAVLWLKNAWEVNDLSLSGALILVGLGLLGGLFLFSRIKTIDNLARKAGDKITK
jgi:hypothetical protein